MHYIKNQEIVSIFSLKLYEEITKENKLCNLDTIFKYFKKLTPHLVQNFLESLDEYIFKTDKRKLRYESKGLYKRTIITKYGEVTFKRRYYIAKDDTGTNGFLLDRYLNLIPYSKLTRDAKEEVIKSIADNPSYRVAGKNAIDGVILSKQTVYNCLKDATITTKPRETKLKVPVIHISVDGFYVSQKGNENKVEKKFANIFTGIEKISKKRNKLINSIIVVQNNYYYFVRAIRKALKDNFDLSINPKIIVGGDGASWIKTLANELNAIFTIDKFHFLRAIHKNIPEEFLSDVYHQIYNNNYLFYENYKDFFQIINNDDGTISYNDDYRFIKNNAKYTSVWNDDDYIGTFAEQTVSHVFNLRTRSIPRAWGSNLNKVMFLLANSNSNDLVIAFDNDLDCLINSIDDLYFPLINLSSFRPSNKSSFSLVNSNADSHHLNIIKRFL